LPTDFHLDLASLGEQLIVNVTPVPMSIGSDKAKSFVPLPQEFARKKILPGFGSERFVVDSSGVRLLTGEDSHYFPLSLVPSFENIVALSEDRYLFCLENGFAVLDKRHLARPKPAEAPAAVVRWVETASGETFLPNHELKFDWRQNSLKFRFSVPFFERSPNFSWRLEGFSSQWSPWQNSPEKEFTNLPSGDYVFVVRADTGGPEAWVKFRIAPPWYRSTWALGVYTLLAVSFFWSIEKINQARLERQRRHLENEKERELARQRAEAEREKLVLEVENKSRELSNAALNLIRKNTALWLFKQNLKNTKHDSSGLPKIVRQIDEHLEGDHDWEIFEESFNRVHDDFFKRLMHDFPDLTPGDLRLAAYLKMNLASKEIAPLLNISVRGVENKRYRLRKKLGLPEDANLTEFVMSF
jgi:DNA-binding CsgD family transcriptional regulator